MLAAMPDATDPRLPLMRLILGGMAAQVPRAFVDLGVADRMGAGTHRPEALAGDLGLHAPSLARLLAAAATLDLAAAEPDGRFRLTAMGMGLRRDVAGGLGAVASMYAAESFWKTAFGLPGSVRSGRTAIDGADRSFDLYAQDPALAAGFDAAMTAMSDWIGPQVAAAYPFEGLCVDVGAGQGRLMGHVLQAHPAARGIVFDLPPVAAKARTYIAGLGLSDRCEVAEGDLFETVPAGGDLYLLSAVIHDWDDAAAVKALRSCRHAMRPDGRLLVIERVLSDAPAATRTDQSDALTDLLMMVRNGGRERTAPAYGALLSQAGFDMLRVIPTEGPRSLVEARPWP